MRNDRTSFAYAVIGALLMLGALAAPQQARAQNTDNDYYQSRGTALLNTVEKYHLYPGLAKYRDKHYDQAWQDFDFLLRYFPNHPRGLVVMTELCSEWKSGRCALDVMFDKAIAVRPDAAGTFVAYGIYLHRIKRYNEAIETYQRALTLDPDSVNGHYNLALAYLDTKSYDLANEHAQRAYALGATVPGLRERLKKLGYWKPLPKEEPGTAQADSPQPTSPSAAPTDATQETSAKTEPAAAPR